MKLRLNRSREHSDACDVFLQPGHNRQPNQTVQEKLELEAKNNLQTTVPPEKWGASLHLNLLPVAKKT